MFFMMKGIIKIIEFGNISDILSSFAAILALVLTIFGIMTQKKQARLSMLPICFVAEIFHQKYLAVRIVNVGTGTMYIDKFEAKKGTEIKDNLIQFMPKFRNQLWTSFSLEISNRPLLAGNKINLFVMEPDGKKTKKIYNQIQKALTDIEITIFYHDVFQKKYVYKKKLQYNTVLTQDFPYKAK